MRKKIKVLFLGFELENKECIWEMVTGALWSVCLSAFFFKVVLAYIILCLSLTNGLVLHLINSTENMVWERNKG